MTRYELKDKDKQAKYLAVFPDFLTALTNAMNHRDPETRWISVRSGEYEYSVNVYPEEVETFAEYNPHAWNNYPEVTPPEGVVMRLEITEAPFDKGLEGHKACATWLVRTFEILDDDRKTKINTTEGRWYLVWRDSEPDEMLETYGFTPEEKIFKARFRPWDDEEAAK